jgi:hypothetical protein
MQKHDGKPRNFGASIPDEIMGLKDIRDRAFRLSNELLGAYDEVSVTGQELRMHIWPFWSWKETNFKRYARIVKNTAYNNEVAGQVGKRLLAGTRMGAHTAMKIGRFAIKAFALTGLLAAYNNLITPEQEKDLPEDVRARPHLNLGRNKDGSVRTFTRLGALGDFMEWFGMDASYSQVNDFLNGRRSVKEIALDMLKAPVNVAVSGISPFIKTPIELAVRRSLFPDVFNPRLIRDRNEYLFKQVGLDKEYRLIAGKPGPSYKSTLKEAFIYSYDPLQAAYYDFMDIKRDYLKSIGREGGGAYLSPSSNALYNMKLAHRYGEKDKVDKYLQEYRDIVAMQHKGESRQKIDRLVKTGIERSFSNLHPLFGIKEADWPEYVSSLDDDAKEVLSRALRFYSEVLVGNSNTKTKE